MRGWAGLDPSNAMMTEHIALVQGRGNAGISPSGTIVGSREQNVDVKVDVVPRE